MTDTLGYRLAVGSLLVLTVLLLLQRVAGAQNLPSSVAGSSTMQQRGFDLFLGTLLIVGLTVWILSAIGTDALFRLELERLGENPSRGAIAAQLVSTLAFRSWVAALVVLILRRLRFRLAAPTASQAGEG